MRKNEAAVAHKNGTQAVVAHHKEVEKERLHLKVAAIKLKELLQIDQTQLKIRKLRHHFRTLFVSTLTPVLNFPQIYF